MSDLRETIAKALFERILGPWVWEGANKRFSADYLAYADVVIAVIATRIEELEAELAEVKAQIARVAELLEDRYCYDANDTHDRADAAINELIGDIRAVLSPQGSLAGSTIQAKDD